MSDVKKIGTLFAPSAIAASGEASPRVAANLVNYYALQKGWRSPDATDTTLTVDLGAVTALNSLAIVRGNFASLQILGCDDEVWASAAFDTGVLTATANGWTGLRHKYIPLTAFSYRYLQVVIPAQTPDSGAAYFELAKLCLISDEIDMPVTEWGDEAGTEEPVSGSKGTDGSTQTANMGTARWKISFGWQTALNSDVAAPKQVAQISQATPVCLYLNAGDDSEVYVCNKTGDVTVKRSGYQQNAVGTFTFREI